MDECVAFQSSVKRRRGLLGSEKDVWVALQTVRLACYHKIAESMWHEEHNCMSSSGLGGKRHRRVETNEADSPVSRATQRGKCDILKKKSCSKTGSSL